MHFGEYELSPSLIGLSLLPSGHPKAFNAYRFGPPVGVTRPSTCPRVDHLVSRLPIPTIFAVFRLAFASAPNVFALSLAGMGNS